MPHETITRMQEAAVDSTEKTEYGLELGWSREFENVQVGLMLPADDWHRISAEIRHESEPGNITTSDGVGVRIAARAVYTRALTRSEINHLIRTLRRARDAAYGSDE